MKCMCCNAEMKKEAAEDLDKMDKKISAVERKLAKQKKGGRRNDH